MKTKLGPHSILRFAGAAVSLSCLILLSCLVVFTCLAMLSCSSDDGAEVVFWQFQRQGLMNDLIADFEAENPDIKVKLETLTWQSGYEKIIMAYASGQLPDLLEVGSTWMPKLQAEGAVSDITGLTADLEPELMMWDLSTFAGRRYGMPWLIGSRVLFYNRDLFAAAGLSSDDPPATWSELKDAARRIHNPDEGRYGFGMNAGERYVLYKKFMPFAWGCGGRILSDDLSRSELDSPRVLEALEFYLSLKPYSVLERQDMIDDLFKQGRVGMMISGGWNLERIPEDAPGLDFGVALMPRPGRSEKPYRDDFHASFAGAEILVLPRGSRTGPAMRLARFLIEADQALRISSTVKGVQPASREALVHPYYDDHPMERLLMEQGKTSLSPPLSPHWVEIEEIINTRLEECIYGNLTPAEALRLMHEEVSAIIEE
ncbi:extracellular solute-binding protein [Candidatus Eisenbacteria bacterium]|uniref:Extracellular solute-binding protein n=1 Tax=Eiseniibacteriota bacterium TaxID=2212470 RepID=A0ABV6YNF2_UNCEI